MGHGLEVDLNRKSISHYYDKLGQKVASEKYTIIDEGCIPNWQGALNFDDEGVSTQKQS